MNTSTQIDKALETQTKHSNSIPQKSKKISGMLEEDNMPQANSRLLKKQSNTTDREKVLTAALIKAADWLGIKSAVLAAIIGVSQPTISRMKAGNYVAEEGSKTFELSAFFVRAFRSLFAIVGGDQLTARNWLINHNTALRGTPLELMKTIRGINDVCSYLDARRAVI